MKKLVVVQRHKKVKEYKYNIYQIQKSKVGQQQNSKMVWIKDKQFENTRKGKAFQKQINHLMNELQRT